MRCVCLLGLLIHAAAPAQPYLPLQMQKQRVLRVSAPWPIDAFTLTDQHGQAFTQDALTGRWTFVLFGDTACAAPCTDALSALDGLFRRIAPAEVRKLTQVLFVSMDPQQDRPDRLRDYLAPFDKRFLAGAGPPATVERLVDDWRVGKEAGSQGAMPNTPPTYSGSLLLVGPDGTVRAEYLPPFDVALLTADYLRTRLRRRGSP